MRQVRIAEKADTIRLTAAEIRKLPVEMQHEIKGAITILKILKAQRKKKGTV